MKTRFFFLFLTAMLLSIGAFAQSNETLKGDVNGDGEIDIADAVCVVNYIVGNPTPTFVALAADANGDGDIDIADAVTIVNYIVGNPSSLSTETTYYWYVGTTPIDDTNYNDTNIVSQVTTIPEETTITTNDEYFYIVVPKEKTITVIDPGTGFGVNIKTYNSSTHTFTNAETYVGDYAIYRSTGLINGTVKIIVN